MRRPEHLTTTETEATLVVVSDTPGEITDAIAALTELDGLALLQRPDLAIRDRYFDTAAWKLASIGTALRLREVGPARLLTIKGPSRPGLRGGITRDEHEEVWPDPAWTILHAVLGDALAIPAGPPASSDPVTALRALGLAVVQDRETSRRVRAIAPQGAPARPVAELAVDSVTFHLVVDVRHHEVEVEVKAAGGDDALVAVTEALLARFGPSVRPWRAGKLATGKAIATLIEQPDHGGLLTGDGTLRPSAYEAIADLQDRYRADAGRPRSVA